MTTREIKDNLMEMKVFSDNDIGPDPIAWLTKNALDDMILLAHAEDGVIWGQVLNKVIVTPSPLLIQQALFRSVSLLDARLFNATSEIYLWRIEEGRWRARQLTDGKGETVSYLEEAQVLWGTTVEDIEFVDQSARIGFSRVSEGTQGMRYAAPLILAKEIWKTNRLRLGIRHYLHKDEGWQRIAFSRLFGVWIEEELQ